MFESNTDIKGKSIWSVITVEQLAAAIASLGDCINQLQNEISRSNTEAKLPTSL